MTRQPANSADECELPVLRAPWLGRSLSLINNFFMIKFIKLLPLNYPHFFVSSSSNFFSPF